MKKIKVIIAVILSTVLIGSGISAVALSVADYCLPLFSESEGSAILGISTYIDGKDQPTHPSVIDMKKEWNGYRYWMAYSPYPYSSGSEENPCICVSNDMYNWTVPQGLNNPIAFNEETSCDELKDPHILYNEKNNTVEVWYLGRLNSTLDGGGQLLLFRKVSKDGVHWSDYEIMREMNEGLSQSVIYDGKYKLWSISPSTDGRVGKLLYSESDDGKKWTNDKPCSFNGRPEVGKIWHGAVSFDGKYRFVYIDASKDNGIFYSESANGIAWSGSKQIIERKNFWASYYRPCILYTQGKFYCIYGVITGENEWFLSMSVGESVDELKGITVNEVGNSAKNEEIHSRRSLKNTVSDIYEKFKYYINPLLTVLCVSASYLLWMLMRKESVTAIWATSWLLMVVRQYGVLLYDTAQMSILMIFSTGIICLVCSFAVIGIEETIRKSKKKKS